MLADAKAFFKMKYYIHFRKCRINCDITRKKKKIRQYNKNEETCLCHCVSMRSVKFILLLQGSAPTKFILSLILRMITFHASWKFLIAISIYRETTRDLRSRYEIPIGFNRAIENCTFDNFSIGVCYFIGRLGSPAINKQYLRSAHLISIYVRNGSSIVPCNLIN